MDRKPRCPTCKKEIEKTPFFPFCSERCKLVDLGRWIGEEFRIPTEDTSSEPEPKDDKKIVH